MSLVISFTSLSYAYVALPDGYPVQSFGQQELQAAVYTESKDQSGFVTVLLPLVGNLSVRLPDKLMVDQEGYHFDIGLNYDESQDDHGRLAMIRMAVDFPEVVSMDGKWRIGIHAPEEEWKLVMDSNLVLS